MSDSIDVPRLKEAARAAFADRDEVVCAYAFGSRIAGRALPASGDAREGLISGG